MTNNLLEELDIPRPPYRMARPVASLASADEPPAHRADITSEEALKKEFESALPTEPKPEEKSVIEPSIEQPATPEQIDQSVDSKAEDAKQRVDATPSPDVAAKEAAKNEIEEARTAFQASIKRKAADFPGKEKKLGALEEEFESAKAALHRAEAVNKPQEVQRLTKLTQQYSDALERKAAEAVRPAGPGVGDIVTEGKIRARVLEVNAEGRPTRLETIEEKKPEPAPAMSKEEPIPIMRVTPEQQEAMRVAGERGVRAEKEEKEKAETEMAVPEVENTDERQLQEERARKEDIAFKSAVTKSQTAAMKENEAREAGAKEVGSERVNMPPSPEILATREAAEAKNNEPKELQSPAPESVERPKVGPENPLEHAAQKEEEVERKPLREYISPFDYVRGALDWAVEKSGTKPWLDTLAPRLESVFHRQMAEVRMMQQVRAQGLLNRANNKLGNWDAAGQSAGWPMKLFYANRVRAWQKHANKCEARVDKYESVRHRWQEKHNDLQKQVSGRYERELEPYRELATALKSKEAAAMDVRKNLSSLRQDAVKKLAATKADAGKRSTIFMSSRARHAIKEIEQEVKSLERLEAQADKSVAKARAPLARAQAGIDKWELKQKTVAQRMKFPEAAGLTRPKRTTVEAPPQAGIATTAGPEQRPTAEGPVMEQRMAEEWQPADFVKRWNAYTVDLAIEKTEEFAAFVAAERAKHNQQGTPTRQQLLDLTQQYQQQRLSPNAMKKFKASRDLFATKVNK